MWITDGGGGYSSFADELKATIEEKTLGGEPVELTPQEIMARVLRDEFFNQCMPKSGQFGREDRIAGNCFGKAQNLVSSMTKSEIEEKFDTFDDEGTTLRQRARKFLNSGHDIFENSAPRDCSYTHRFFARDSEEGLHCGIEGFCGDEFVWRIESAEYCYQAFGCAAPPIGSRP